MKIRGELSGLVLLAASGMVAAEGQGLNPTLNEKFSFAAGVLFADTDGSIGSDRNGIHLPDIDLDTLGVDDDVTSPYFAARWRAGERWQFLFNYFGFDNTGDLTGSFDLDYENIDVSGTVRLDSKIETDFYVLQAGYALIRDERTEVGLGLGLHVLDLDTRLSVTGSTNNYTGQGGTETTKITAPLPNILAFGSYALTPKLSVYGSLAYFSLSYDKYDGSLFRGVANLEYRFTDHFGAGIGYNYVNMNLDIEKDTSETEYDLTYSGPVVFVSAGF